MAPWSIAYEGRNLIDDDPLLVGTQFRVNRQGQNLLRRAESFRQVQSLVAEIAVALLLVQSQRIINLRADARLGERFTQCIALAVGHADDILIPHMFAAEA